MGFRNTYRTEDDRPQLTLAELQEKVEDMSKAVYKKTAFRINEYVHVELKYDLAQALGEFILAGHPDNPAIQALGHQLDNLGESYDDNRDEQDETVPAGQVREDSDEQRD